MRYSGRIGYCTVNPVTSYEDSLRKRDNRLPEGREVDILFHVQRGYSMREGSTDRANHFDGRLRMQKRLFV